jgi:diacylglycerol kinase (ATP)
MSIIFTRPIKLRKMSIKLKIGFIINPISGTRTKKNIPELINNKINTDLFEPVIKFTTCAGNATELTRQMVSEGFHIVVAVGGDGTINEVATALVHTNTALAIIPCGSGNGLARHLEIPLKIDEAIEVINNHKIVNIDYGSANDILFFCTCGVGFDAQIGHQFAQSKKRGFFTYIKSVVAEFIKYKAKKYRFKTKDKKFRKQAFLVTFANASQYGNDAYIAPNADIQDGLLDVCILKPFPSYKVFEIGMKLMRKKIDNCQSVEFLRTDKIKIKRKKKGIFHYDGEPCYMKKKIVVRAHKQGLKVAVAKKSKLQ